MQNPILSKIEDWANKTPDNTAIITAEKTLTYEELIQAAHTLACYIHTNNLAKEGAIGIYLSQCYELPICMLAAWMLGVPYIPLDPIYPPHRILEIVGRSKPSCILAKESSHPSFKDRSYPIIDVDTLLKNPQNIRDIPLPSIADPLAYLIFTSGTTGIPKGVEVTIDNLMNLLTSFEKKLAVTSEDRLLSITPISFDIFGLELFLPLVCGATCVFNARSHTLDPRSLLEQLKTHKITLFQAVPSIYHMLVEESWDLDLNIRHFLCGGESWNRNLADQVHEKMPQNCTLWNVYGPTETTIWSSATKVEKKGEIHLSPSIEQTYFEVLNSNLESTEEGELYIGGSGVAKGYYQDPSLTKERFVQTSQMRMYKTGDIVRKTSENTFVFVGRQDQQVKIRGFRVELGDIEQKILKHPAVSRVSVIYDYVKFSHEKSLVACIEYAQNKGEETKNLRSFLHRTLPSYMIPQFFIGFEALPLTPNLKIDRNKIQEKLKRRFQSK